MTIATLVECNVCHSKYRFKILCDHVLNHDEMPIRIGCHCCGNMICGSISKTGIILDGAQTIPNDLGILSPYPCVGISMELPIVKECFFTTSTIINNILLLPNYLGQQPIETHSAKMHFFEGAGGPNFKDLNTLHNVKCSGNFQEFDQFAKEHFDKDDSDVTDSPNKMRLGFTNLYAQLFKHIRSHSYSRDCLEMLRIS